jgi:hypothetical protein
MYHELYQHIFSEIMRCQPILDALDMFAVYTFCLFACVSTHGALWIFHTMLPYTVLLGNEYGKLLIQAAFIVNYSGTFTLDNITMVHTCLHLAAIGHEQECNNIQMIHVTRLVLLLTCEWVGCSELAVNICQLNALYAVITTITNLATFDTRLIRRCIFLLVEIYLFYQQTIFTDLVASYQMLCSEPTSSVEQLTYPPLRCCFGFPLMLYTLVMMFCFSCLHAAETLGVV